MKTIVYKVNEIPEDKWLTEAGEILEAGGLVAIPTETVYGLAANALDEKAAAKIYAAKGRPSDNPLIVHIADMKELEPLVSRLPEAAVKLAEQFWPGPLTMILPKSPKVPYGTTGGLETVAIRMPSHPVARKLIRTSGIPLAAPSANTSGRPSPTRASHVYDDLDGKIDMILDDGPVGIGIESTIVDVSGDTPMILRPGYITEAMLAEVVGKVTVDPAILSENKDKNFHPKAPGMKYKHYAPKGELFLVSGENSKVVEKITELTLEKVMAGQKVGIVATDETKDFYQSRELMKNKDNIVIMSIGTRKDEGTISHNLYDILRRMDGEGVDYIYSESFAEGERGQAIMNRLLKAAAHRQIYV
ncbi:MAG: threonylcarbamoyl-AMP synthase [Clostridia bacterium]|nr:L-threonylcarbamoyladenylate synthase [Lachnospiraceae bacterium]NCC01869.1 threonylcarbamoyl-AMP synthase [Clostridia bacterium]NCD02437.1 threonylcarbamoyl-AMP synthase [Clostridia bacterium]